MIERPADSARVVPNARPSNVAGRLLVLVLIMAGLCACAQDDSIESETLRVSSAPLLVSDLERMGGDYPPVLIDGLSRQLIDEVNCIQPGVLTRFDVSTTPGSIYTTNNIPHLLRPEAVVAAEGVAALAGDYITITSGYRDVGMQYYDYLWGQRLGFLAARPGSSRHQAGQAIDVEFHEAWRQRLLDYGWSWPYGTDDRPHFEWRENNTPDLMVESVRAFQRLWNRNNDNDTIAEDGKWGPNTESRMAMTHAEGFEFGGCDVDKDGFAAVVIGGVDCNDADPEISPDALEICGDQVDQDCSGDDEACAMDVADVSGPDASDPSPSDTAVDTQDSVTVDQGAERNSDIADRDLAADSSRTDFSQADSIPSDAVGAQDLAADVRPSAPDSSRSIDSSSGPNSFAPVASQGGEDDCGCRIRGGDPAKLQWGISLLILAIASRRRLMGRVEDTG